MNSKIIISNCVLTKEHKGSLPLVVYEGKFILLFRPIAGAECNLQIYHVYIAISLHSLIIFGIVALFHCKCIHMSHNQFRCISTYMDHEMILIKVPNMLRKYLKTDLFSINFNIQEDTGYLI